MRVAVVDDHKNFRAIVADFLRKDGHFVNELGDETSLLSALGRAPLDVIVCDLRLPDASALSTVERVRRHPNGAEIPFVLMTGDVREELTSAAYRAGASIVLHKPFTIDALRAVLARVTEVG